MNKIRYVFSAILFGIFIFIVSLINIILPDSNFSEMENRNLKLFPDISYNRVMSGKFMDEIEEYFSDQIILREKWIELKACIEKIVGKCENNGIYFADDGYLIKK